MAALKLFQGILGPRGPTSKKTSMAAFKGTQDPLGPRSPRPPKKQIPVHSGGPVGPQGGEGGGEREREREREREERERDIYRYVGGSRGRWACSFDFQSKEAGFLVIFVVSTICTGMFRK